MTTPYRYTILALLLCLVALSTKGQTNYLLNFEHKEPRASESIYFYLEELPAGTPQGQANIVTLDDALYRVRYVRLRERFASSYFGCTVHASQARGEELHVNRLLADSVLLTYDQRQEAIEAECNGLFDNKGRQNSLLSLGLNNQDNVKMLKIDLDLCSCQASREKFSSLSDTLAMPRKIVKTGIFSDAEKAYWENRIHAVMDNAFVKSCLPAQDRYFKSLQAGQE